MSQLEIRSPMVGKILEIRVAVGDRVTEGDEIVLLESMKMEIPVFAPGSGRVASIAVAVGQQVQEGDVLLAVG